MTVGCNWFELQISSNVLLEGKIERIPLSLTSSEEVGYLAQDPYRNSRPVSCSLPR